MQDTLYSFGPFVLHSSERVLRRSGDLVSIPPKAFSLLQELVASGGRVLPKDELLRTVWPDSFVEEGNLTQNISILRKIFAEDFPTQSPIETIARVGYRFRAPVELQEINAGGPEPASPPLPPSAPLSPAPPHIQDAARNRSPWVIAICTLALVVAVLGYWRGWRPNHSLLAPYADPVRFTTKATEDAVTATAISPNGRMVAYADADGILLQALDNPAAHLLHAPPLTNVDHLAWFPDGLRLIESGRSSASGNRELWVISLEGIAPVLLRANARLGVPSPDGTHVAFTSPDSSSVWVSGPSGESPRQLLTPSAATTFPSLLWLSDGKTLLLHRHVAVSRSSFPPGSPEAVHGFHGAVVCVDAASGKQTSITADIRLDDAVLLEPGRLIYARSEPTHEHDGASSWWEVRIDASTGAFQSAPQEVRETKGFRVIALSYAAQTGEIAALLKQGWPSVYVASINPAGPALDDVRRLSLDLATAYPHGWTHDSNAVLYESNRGERNQIYKQALDRHDPEAIAANSENQSNPRSTPDGQWIFFDNSQTIRGPGTLYRAATQGGGAQPVSSVAPPADFRCPLLAGHCLTRSKVDSQMSAFSVLDPLTGKGKLLFTTSPEFGSVVDWDISPDGASLVLLPSSTPAPMLRIVTLASGRTHDLQIHLQARLAAVNYAADGRGWFIATIDIAGTHLCYVDALGKSILLKDTSGATWGVPSPDRKKLAFADQNVDSNVWLLQRH